MIKRTILDRILEDVRSELAAARAAVPPGEIRARLAGAPPPRMFLQSISGEGFALIAEIKQRSPSVGAMREQNVLEAQRVYDKCLAVKAISVLTNRTHFGGSVQKLLECRLEGNKPLLRKDFLIDEYQVLEARAFGADAVLLMANVLGAPELQGFYDLARELGMQALFEVHTEEEIAKLPPDAAIVGINSRKFVATEGFSGADGHSAQDFSVHLEAFALAAQLPEGCVKVAESGLSPQTVGRVVPHFDAALVGTSLLRDERGVEAALADFARAIEVCRTNRTVS